jgi:hypothetical protein
VRVLRRPASDPQWFALLTETRLNPSTAIGFRMSEDALDRELLARLFLLKTTIPGPYTEDLWKRECLRDEFERRGTAEPLMA